MCETSSYLSTYVISGGYALTLILETNIFTMELLHSLCVQSSALMLNNICSEFHECSNNEFVLVNEPYASNYGRVTYIANKCKALCTYVTFHGKKAFGTNKRSRVISIGLFKSA